MAYFDSQAPASVQRAVHGARPHAGHPFRQTLGLLQNIDVEATTRPRATLPPFLRCRCSQPSPSTIDVPENN